MVPVSLPGFPGFEAVFATPDVVVPLLYHGGGWYCQPPLLCSVSHYLGLGRDLSYGAVSVLSAQRVSDGVRPGSCAAVLPFKWACGWVGMV